MWQPRATRAGEDMGGGRARGSGRAITAAAVLLAASCGGDGAVEVGAPRTITVASDDLRDGDLVPVRFTCDGDDVPPELGWEGLPEDTVEVVVVVDDPDAPGGTFAHWTVWGLAGSGGAVAGPLPSSAVEGANDFGTVGYRGPCPPPGDEPHGYRFRVLAVDAPLTVESGAAPEVVAEALDGHVLAEGVLRATYAR